MSKCMPLKCLFFAGANEASGVSRVPRILPITQCYISYRHMYGSKTFFLRQWRLIWPLQEITEQKSESLYKILR